MKYKLLILIAILTLMPLVSAQEIRFVGTEDTNLPIKEPCFNNGTYCSTAAVCNLSVWDSNGDLLFSNRQMTNQLAFHNYTLNATHTADVGEYEAVVVCTDNGLSNFDTFSYEINPTGVRASDQRSTATTMGIYALLGLAAVLFLGFMFMKTNPPVKWTLFVFSLIFFVAGLNVIFITMRNEAVSSDLVNLFDGLSAISFIFYWFAGGFLIILWIFTFINTWLYKENMRNAKRLEGFQSI